MWAPAYLAHSHQGVRRQLEELRDHQGFKERGGQRGSQPQKHLQHAHEARWGLKEVPPVQESPSCSRKFLPLKEVSPVQKSPSCSRESLLFKKVPPVRERSSCSRKSPLYKDASPVQQSPSCSREALPGELVSSCLLVLMWPCLASQCECDPWTLYACAVCTSLSAALRCAPGSPQQQGP